MSAAAEADWLRVLREKVGSNSQKAVAQTIGYSASTISNVLAGKYRGDLEAVGNAVRGAFMAGKVACPRLGLISLSVCGDSQRRTRMQAITMGMFPLWRACRQGCPHSRLPASERIPETDQFDPFKEYGEDDDAVG
jgi:hypothetical protein